MEARESRRTRLDSLSTSRRRSPNAERLGVPLGTVKSRIRLATTHFRGSLQDLA
jgi:hypothetical protein